MQQVRDAGIATHYIRSKRLTDVGKGLEEMKLSKGPDNPITDAENEVELTLGEVEVVRSPSPIVNRRCGMIKAPVLHLRYLAL